MELFLILLGYISVINKPAVPPSQMQQQSQQRGAGQQQQHRSPSMPLHQGEMPTPRAGVSRDQSSFANEGMPAMPPSANPGGDPRSQTVQTHPRASPEANIPGQEALRPHNEYALQQASSHTPGSNVQYAAQKVNPPVPVEAQAFHAPVKMPTMPSEASFQVNRPQRGASIGASAQQNPPEPATLPVQDVHYDGRRNTAELDTYDIISA